MKIVLSKRLETIASFIPIGVRFADIGSDHAYIPCAVCNADQTSSAVAGEVREGPFQSAKRTVNASNLSHQVDVRLGDGLDVIDSEVTLLIIAGMGGALIESILERGKHKIANVNKMILQPNVGSKSIRKWLYLHGFIVTNEQLIEENGHIYEVLIASRKDTSDLTITEKELFFGPVLLQNKSALFVKKWAREREHLEQIVEQMKQSTNPTHQQVDQFRQQIQWIEEELNNET